jgi:hypothetical protein
VQGDGEERIGEERSSGRWRGEDRRGVQGDGEDRIG